MKFPDDDDYSAETSFNIDIEFSSVSYIDIPVSFTGIKIQQIHENINLRDMDVELVKFDRKVFQIESSERKYYIIAGEFLIGTNNWENQDRIFDYTLNLQHAQIITKS